MIDTALTRMFGLRHPIVLGPMGGVAGGRLAAAVSNAGGLGLVGGGYGDPDWMRTELAIAAADARAPWGVGLITWAANDDLVALALRYRPHAFMLSFGDPLPFVAAIKAAGCKLICQVQDLDTARQARDAGADLIVAQGTEGGGHGGVRATLPLVPAVVDAVAPIPVLAAGGIADGRGVAAALMLGAQGALIGTRFYACTEALGHARAKQRIADAGGAETARTRVFDIVRGYDWPGGYTGRAIVNRFMRRWHGQESGLAANVDTERAAFFDAAREGDIETAMVWAGEAVDLIDRIEDAATLVERIGQGAEAQLRAASGWLVAQ
ncbi:MAG TPA: nitronate monooxygenase [Burkholderiaceae bacterium]|jgi:nitronate monooxygenase|nr:nitronate monooxygenase [Burkholderiaceae bacterium]